jgi:hypothetical protein
MYNQKNFSQPNRKDNNLKAATAGSANRPGYRGALPLHEDKACRHVHYHGGCFIGACRHERLTL